jgi:putative DNA primase/helicase
MNLSQTYGNMALTLHDNGYTPIPIKPSSKQPMISNWTELKNEFETIDKLSKQYSNAGVGILLNELIVFDIDVLDTDLCLKVKSIITNYLGETIERIGKLPKRALFYKREGDEFKKQTSKAYIFSNGKAQLEVLAKGNQCVVYGVHPDTRKPYHWVGESVVDVPLESLPTVSLKTVKSIISEVDILLSSQPNLKPQTKPISQKVLTPYKNESISQDGKMIISAIRYIDPEDYDTWINVGFALKRYSI